MGFLRFKQHACLESTQADTRGWLAGCAKWHALSFVTVQVWQKSWWCLIVLRRAITICESLPDISFDKLPCNEWVQILFGFLYASIGKYASKKEKNNLLNRVEIPPEVSGIAALIKRDHLNLLGSCETPELGGLQKTPSHTCMHGREQASPSLVSWKSGTSEVKSGWDWIPKCAWAQSLPLSLAFKPQTCVTERKAYGASLAFQKFVWSPSLVLFGNFLLCSVYHKH